MLKKLITFSAILCTGQAWAACVDGAAGPNGVVSATGGSTCDSSRTSYRGNNTAYANGSGSVLNFLPGTVISSNGVAAVQTLAVGGVNSGGSIPEAGATVHAKGDLTVNGNAQGSTRSIFIYSGTDAGGKRNLLQIDGNLTATRTGGLYGAVIENTGGDLLVAGKTSLTSNVSDALRNGWDANSTFRGSTSINVSGSNGISQSGGTVNFNGDLTINTTTGNGIKTIGGVLNARELYIDVKSGVGNGIAISDRGIVNISGGKIITEGKGSTAISLNGGAFSSTDALSILTKSNDSQGIVLSGDAKAILARTDIQTQGDNANGINIINTPTNGVTLYFQDAISIETLGGGSNAIASKNNPANGFVLPAGSMLVTQGENSHGIDMQIESGGGDLTVFELASGANIETHGKNASALFISNDDGEVNIKTASKIIASGAGSYGIEIDSALRGANIINTGEISASDIGINFNTGVQGNVFNAGTISSDNNIAVHFADEINTLTLTSGSQIKGSVLGGAFDDSLILQGTNSEDLSKFNDFNKLVMEGDEWTLNDNGIFSDSYTQKSGVVNLVGTLVTPQVNVEGGTLNLWKSQTWDTLINGGKISLNTTGNVGNTLNVKGDYNGSNGVLVFNTALGSDHSLSDKLVIYGNAMGTTSVVVNNAGGTGAHTIDGIELIQVNGTSTDTAFTQAGRIVAGAHDYKLVKGNASGTNTQSWFLTNPDPYNPDNPDNPDNPTIRPEAGSYMANIDTARKIFNSRLEDREGRSENSSMWLRQQGTRTTFYDTSGQSYSATNTYVVQGGGELFSANFSDLDRLGIGMMLAYGNSSNNTGSNRTGYHSKGSVDGYSAGLYATWYQDAGTLNGIYIDTWLQYSWLNGMVKGDQLSNENYKIDGLSASVETGYRKLIYQGANGNVFLIPQGQFIFSGVEADDVKEFNGTHVTTSGNNNIQSRLGVKLSREGTSKIDKGEDKLFTVYAEANWLNNSRQVGAEMNGVSIKQAGNKNVAELKLGTEGKFNKNMNLWTNVAQQIGAKGYSDTTMTIGFKYSF